MRPYNWNDWGITPAEYEMLCQAYEQGILSNRQIENGRLLFKWGDESVSNYIRQLDWRHEFCTNIAPVRDSVDQVEFEEICLDVMEQFSQVNLHHFGPAEFHFTFPSQSGRTTHKSAVYFDDGGIITGLNWVPGYACRANLPKQIGRKVSTKIKSALYA